MSQCTDDDVYYKNIDISFHIIITVGGGNLAHRSDAVYFAELMVVQYACDQLIGIDNANIKECLASDAQKYALKPRTCFATACVIKSTLLASIKLLCEPIFS